MPQILVRQSTSAANPEEATDALRAAIGVGRVTAEGGPFEHEQLLIVDDGVSVARIRSAGTGVRVSEVAPDDLVVVALHEGELEVEHDGGAFALAAGGLVLLPPGAASGLRWDTVVLDLYAFPQSSVGRLLGVPGVAVRLRAATLVPRSAEVVAFWLRLAALLVSRVLHEPDLYARDQIREQVIDALVGTTVEAFGLAEAEEEAPGAATAVVQRAEAWMSAHLSDPITIPAVAAAVDVSVRTLQLAFERARALSPQVRLRELRLAAARTALAGAADRSTTVVAVARRFGYSNVGRFGAYYRSAYGESPSETLRAARARHGA
jgi:AraC-like DNA-binding protein